MEEQHPQQPGSSVCSFGTGIHMKLPAPAPDKSNVYDFKPTYDQMYNDLLRKDKKLYTQNGILLMLDRNKRIKPHPERFQNFTDQFDLIFTCEERVYNQVVEDLNSREQQTCQPVHVASVDIQDNHEETPLGAFLICEFCQYIHHTEDMENEINEQKFEEKSGQAFLHTVCFHCQGEEWPGLSTYCLLPLSHPCLVHGLPCTTTIVEATFSMCFPL